MSGVDVGEEGAGSAAEDGADGGEEAERGGDDGVAEDCGTRGPMPAAARASQRASVPLAQPMA